MSRIYLDYNATTPVDAAVLDAMLPYFSENFANASSIHTPGQKARNAVETAREQVAALIGASPKEIIFTSGGTESDNHAIFGILQPLLATHSQAHPPRLNPPHVITTTIEHEAVLNACQAAEKQGAHLTYLRVDENAQVDPQAVKAAIRPETVLITIMQANNELGTLQPLAEIGKIAAASDIYFHTDAVQSAGKISINVNDLSVDLLALSGHKLYAPKGIGALYIRTGTQVQQLLYGGHHQRGARPGTENVAGIVGLGAAAELARKSQVAEAASYRRPPRSPRANHPRDDPGRPRQRRLRPAHSQHHQHHLPRHRGRSPAHRARPKRFSLLDRCRLLLWLGRTLPRPHRHRPHPRRRPLEPSLQPRPPHYRIRNRDRPEDDPRSREPTPRPFPHLRKTIHPPFPNRNRPIKCTGTCKSVSKQPT